MYPRANQFAQSISRKTKKRSARGMVPPHGGVGKAPSQPSVLQAVLVKIVTEIIFGNAPLANHETTGLGADHRPGHYKNRDQDHTYRIWGIAGTSSSCFKQNRNSLYTEPLGYGSVPVWRLQCRCMYHHHTFMCHIIFSVTKR
jgi:hypothetical protein